MNICFVVDYRSPIARNWIDFYLEHGHHHITIITTYPVRDHTISKAKLYTVPLGLNFIPRPFSSSAHFAKSRPIGHGKERISHRSLTSTVERVSDLARWFHHALIGSLSVRFHIDRVKRLVASIQPDIVHAMRIPFEGILAAEAIPPRIPLVVSVWGNDFTLFAKKYRLIGLDTRRCLARANGLHTDCQRDYRLAKEWGYDVSKSAVVLPGSGGVDARVFSIGLESAELRNRLCIPQSAPVIINPRGIRSYVRNDVFFEAIPRILAVYPDAVFVCVAMQGHPSAQALVERFGVSENVRLLPPVTRQELAELFRMAEVAVSPSVHDGTPNTLLEAMACGCFPVAGDIESIREWVKHERNGLLYAPLEPDRLAHSVIRALQDDHLRAAAAQYNSQAIENHGNFTSVMASATEFYTHLIAAPRSQVL